MKNLFAVLMIASGIVSFVACGGNKAHGEHGKGEKTEEATMNHDEAGMESGTTSMDQTATTEEATK